MRVVHTTLTEAEHKLLVEYAKKNSKTIKEVVRQAIRNTVEGTLTRMTQFLLNRRAQSERGNETALQ